MDISHRLLLCSCDQDYRNALAEHLKSNKLHIDLVSSSAESEYCSARQEYDAVMIDYLIRPLHFMTFAGEVRRQNITKKCAIIVFSIVVPREHTLIDMEKNKIYFISRMDSYSTIASRINLIIKKEVSHENK